MASPDVQGPFQDKAGHVGDGGKARQDSVHVEERGHIDEVLGGCIPAQSIVEDDEDQAAQQLVHDAAQQKLGVLVVARHAVLRMHALYFSHAVFKLAAQLLATFHLVDDSARDRLF